MVATATHVGADGLVLDRAVIDDLELVSNCMVLTEGWNMPEAACIVLARPTRQMGLFRQMVGRVLRPAPGKTDAVVLDHSGAVFRHGFVEDPVDVDARSRAPCGEPRPRGARQAGDGVAPAGVLAVRRGAGCRRGVRQLRVPAAAAAQADPFSGRRAGGSGAATGASTATSTTRRRKPSGTPCSPT